MIPRGRIRSLAERETAAGGYIVYWMQRSQRAECNHALEYAIARGNALGLPVIVGFGLTDDYPEANERHYAFMLEGLRETEATLHRRGIKLVARQGAPDRVANGLCEDAALLVCDRGYLRHEKEWRRSVADSVACPVVEVETDVVVPVDVVARKAEYGARTIRPKLMRAIDEYLHPVPATKPSRSSLDLALAGDVDLGDIDSTLRCLALDRTVGRVAAFCGGRAAGIDLLDAFIARGLDAYAEKRSEPTGGVVSRLSPYLHFGQISPLEVALAAREAATAATGYASFLDELVVRRELAINFVEHEPRYDSYEAMPDWARRTLRAHAEDPRPALYTDEQLETAATDDPYWNAAMTEMRLTGYMHNHMRMYWGKQILAWTGDPAAAFRRTLALNNRWLLDGRDANSFANVGWIFGLHDRPWPERAVFGTVRTMTAGGLRRKCVIDDYLAVVAGLAREAAEAGA
ncbi:MAG: Deoxyribodipyrimidine photolyase, type [Rhodospirillales bacterium]|nr:Deoxyribodipyrimidine photolyase, type [Rhodospirillales bacterium]